MLRMKREQVLCRGRGLGSLSFSFAFAAAAAAAAASSSRPFSSFPFSSSLSPSRRPLSGSLSESLPLPSS